MNFISITSGKGGVGKTTIAANLALLLSREAGRVLLVDGDLGLANVDIFFDLDTTVTLREVLDAERQPREALVEISENLSVLPASSGAADMVNRGPEELGELGRILDGFGEEFRFVIVDTAAGIGSDVLWFTRFSQLRLVVVTPEPTSITDAYALLKVVAEGESAPRFSLIMNRVRDEEEAHRLHDGLAGVCERFLGFRPELLGFLREDASVLECLRAKSLLAASRPDSPAAADLAEIAAHIARATQPVET